MEIELPPGVDFGVEASGKILSAQSFTLYVIISVLQYLFIQLIKLYAVSVRQTGIEIEEKCGIQYR